MILEGYVKNKDGMPVENAAVEIKDSKFVTVYSTESGKEGYYHFDIPAGTYPFLVAVKDYGVSCLEYWCQNIPLQQAMSLDVSFDTLEVYGLHIFSVKGAGNGFMVYFRPMSLLKFQQGEQDIAPEGMTVRVLIDEKETSVTAVNKVKEIVAGQELSAYLIQVEEPDSNACWHKAEVQITDKDGHYGAAAIFNDDV